MLHRPQDRHGHANCSRHRISSTSVLPHRNPLLLLLSSPAAAGICRRSRGCARWCFPSSPPREASTCPPTVAIGLGAKENGLEFVLLAPSEILSRTTVTAFVAFQG